MDEFFVGKAFQKGYEEGLAKGEARALALVRKLLETDRIDDLMRATEDAEYRRNLMKEFGID